MKSARSIRASLARVGLAVGALMAPVGCSGDSGGQATATEAVLKSQKKSADLKKAQARKQTKSRTKSRMPGMPGD